MLYTLLVESRVHRGDQPLRIWIVRVMLQPADMGIGTSGVHDQSGITDIFGEIPYIFESQFMSVVRPVEQRRIEIPFSKSGEWNPLPITRNKITGIAVGSGDPRPHLSSPYWSAA